MRGKQKHNVKACRRNSQWQERYRWFTFKAIALSIWTNRPDLRRRLFREMGLI